MILSRREKVVLSAGVAIAILLSLKLFVAPFFHKVGFVKESLEAKTDLLRRYQQAAGEMGSLEL